MQLDILAMQKVIIPFVLAILNQKCNPIKYVQTGLIEASELPTAGYSIALLSTLLFSLVPVTKPNQVFG